MAKKRINKKSSEIKIKGKYHLTIYAMDKKFECDTDDLKQAILDLKPEKITNKIRIICTKGEKRIEKILFVYPARRIFNIPLATEFFSRNLERVLN